MKIFEIQNNNAHPTTEILLVYPFNEIWERNSNNMYRNTAIREFTYIEFMCSPKKTNPFWGYINLEERSKKIIERVFHERFDWQPDELVKKAIVVYKQFLTEASPSLNYLDAALEGVSKVQDFFRSVNLNQTNNKGALLYKPRDITTAMGDTEKVIKSLNSLREKVEGELFEAGKTMNNRVISKFEE